MRAIALLVLLVAGSAQAQATERRPWRFVEAVGAPSWLGLGLEHRARFEHLANDFRATAIGDSTALSLRTLASAELRFEPLSIAVEAQDSRAFATEPTPLNPTIVDALELLRAYASLRLPNALEPGDHLAISLGRMTLDVGSRRLVARNDFRNTINSFTGLDLAWSSASGHAVRFFAVVPVVRLPSDASALADNTIELDRENLDALFWGVVYGTPLLALDVQVEAYLFELNERDGATAPSSDRRLYTPGLRLLRAPAPERLDLQLELMLQLGRSRATAAATDTDDLSHLAFSGHVSLGYRFAVAWSPRLVLQYDYATGDESPSDDANNRFDPLFGARRFDFGPTGLYGAIARSNVSSPGARVEIVPDRTIDAFVGYRLVWLASPRDAWTTAGLRDPSGLSGAFVGQQLEGRVRWQPFPRNLALELGAACLFRGERPGVRSEPAAYVYSQITTGL
ncbi:alginate export family protein [Sandaracinus amylolyticus]|uniref:alginate export family protein n=1 Tax=Sandaracinus amylolyticus TaxID=927083 RepID=UPI001F27067D|nr:alginate export family protein [Sandaracinus amylolyticus]UJR85747.1 Hypothetical protein I5071_78270 [Sandaracinus amylolyticus]